MIFALVAFVIMFAGIAFALSENKKINERCRTNELLIGQLAGEIENLKKGILK